MKNKVLEQRLGLSESNVCTFGFLGGPLVVQKSFSDDTAVIYGVISHGHKCALENKPGVNTRVTRYIDWIKKRMSLPKPPATIITTTSG